MTDQIFESVASRFTSLELEQADRFNEMAAAVFRCQRTHNAVYGRYCKNLTRSEHFSTAASFDWRRVPYLPVEAFKHAPVTTFAPEEAEAVFKSSGTGRSAPSTHYVRRLACYERAVTAHFERVVGAGPFTFVAHLPHYAERGASSSLLYMVEHLIDRYGDAYSGLFLDDQSLLHRAVAHGRQRGTPFILFGAAFGLLDLVNEAPVALPEQARVIETGGMKTYRRAVSRAELHRRLAEGFSLPEQQIWSEYGMCELMSQCYTRGDHVFYPPPWMRFLVTDPSDPQRAVSEGEPGALALFDLANLHTVSAIQTADRAVRRGDGFEVLGRLSDAELRGCNFLLEEASSS